MWQFVRIIYHSNFANWCLGFFTGYCFGQMFVLRQWAKEYHRERRWIEHLAEKCGQEMLVVDARIGALSKKEPPIN